MPTDASHPLYDHVGDLGGNFLRCSHVGGAISLSLSLSPFDTNTDG